MPYEELQEQFQAKIFALSTKCMVDLRFKGIQASAIAAAIVYYTRTYLQFQATWTEELSRLTQHDPLTSKSARKALDMLFEMSEEEENSNTENDVNLLSDLMDDVNFHEITTTSSTSSTAVTPMKENQISTLTTPGFVKGGGGTDSDNLSPVSVNFID